MVCWYVMKCVILYGESYSLSLSKNVRIPLLMAMKTCDDDQPLMLWGTMIDFSDKHEYQRKPRCMEHIITNIIQSIKVLSQKLIPKDFSGHGWLEIPLSLFDRTMIPKVCFNMFHLNGKILLASHKNPHNLKMFLLFWHF